MARHKARLLAVGRSKLLPCRGTSLLLGVGMATGAGLAIWLRFLSENLPSGPFVPFVISLVLAGTALGSLPRFRKHLTSPRSLLIVLALTLASALVSQGFLPNPIVYFLPISLPKSEPVRWPFFAAIFLLFVCCGAWLQGWWYARLTGLLSTTGRPAAGYALNLLGFAAGFVLARAAILEIGPSWALSAWSLSYLPFFSRQAVRMMVAGAALTVPWFSDSAARASFMWSVQDAHRTQTTWTSYYRVDYYTFEGGRCLGGAYNRFLMWYVCNPPWDYLQRRELFRRLAPFTRQALVVGAAGGNGVQTLVHLQPKIDHVDAVEIDPAVVRGLKGNYARFNSGVYNLPNVMAHAVEGRRFLEETQRRYDVIYFDGIDTGYLSHLFSIFTLDSYLHSAEAYRLIFDHRLQPDGVLVVEAGGTAPGQIGHILAAMPPDIAKKVYWFALSNSPMMGAPLFFVLASRSQERLDAIARSLQETNSLKPVAGAVASPENVMTDDRPFTRSTLKGVMFPVALLILILVSPLGFVLWREAAAARLTRPHRLYFLLAGSLAGGIQGWILARGGTAFLNPGNGIMVLFMGYLLGGVLAGGTAQRLGARLFSLPLGLAAMSLGLLWLRPLTNLSPTLLWAVAATASGFVGGGFWAAGLVRLSRDGIPAALAIDAMGMIVGTLMIQVGIAAVGFTRMVELLSLGGIITSLLFAGLHGMGRLRTHGLDAGARQS